MGHIYLFMNIHYDNNHHYYDKFIKKIKAQREIVISLSKTQQCMFHFGVKIMKVHVKI